MGHGHPETWPSSKTDMFNTAKYNSCLISTAADQIYIASALHGFRVVRISVFHWYFISLYEFILCSFVIVCYLGLPELLIILWTFLCVNLQNSFSRICSLNRHASTKPENWKLFFQNGYANHTLTTRVQKFQWACIFTNSLCPQSLGNLTDIWCPSLTAHEIE